MTWISLSPSASLVDCQQRAHYRDPYTAVFCWKCEGLCPALGSTHWKAYNFSMANSCCELLRVEAARANYSLTCSGNTVQENHSPTPLGFWELLFQESRFTITIKIESWWRDTLFRIILLLHIARMTAWIWALCSLSSMKLALGRFSLPICK